MKSNRPSIYIASKQIKRSRTQSTQSESLEGFSQRPLFRSNSLMLIGKGRLGAIASITQAKKNSHGVQEKEGATETKAALVKQSLAGQKELMFSMCWLLPLLEKSFSRGRDHSLPSTGLTFVQRLWFTELPRYYYHLSLMLTLRKRLLLPPFC